MSVERRIPTRDQDANTAALIQELRQEYRSNNPSPDREPRIIIEEVNPKGPLHVYVIWKKWLGFSHRDRSEIIMDALEKEMIPEEIVKVTLAMGTTPDESNRLGIAV